jgi:hypothetical protein
MAGDRADVIFTGGPVHTVDGDDAVVEALAIADGRVLAVGRASDVAATAGPATRRYDLRGRSLLPGFIDAHHHLTGVGASVDAIDCKAPGMGSITALQEEVRRRAATLPPGTWIRGRGYDQRRLAEQRHPNRADWDAVAPEHPVVFVRTCGHITSFSTRAMERAGLHPAAPDPDGGRHDRDDRGELLGVAYERAAGPLRDASAPTRDELARWLEAAARVDVACGLTSVHDAGGLVGPALDVAADLVAAGRFPLRAYAFATVNTPDHPLLGLMGTGVRTGLGDDRLRIGAFKVMTDGSSSGPTAATRQPYAIDPHTCGIAYWDQEELDGLLGRAHRLGWQCTVHAVGDKAIEQTLDALARAQREHPRAGLRHRIEHCGITPPDLQRRIVEQGVVPAMQPAFFWEFGDGYIRDYGRERADVMFPVRSLTAAGVVVAGSSDAPVTDQRPLFGIEQAQTRATSAGDVCGPDERVDLTAAIRLHTRNAAYAAFDEDRKGSLEPGKLADLVVLDADIAAVPVAGLRDLPVALTMVGGETVHEGG